MSITKTKMEKQQYRTKKAEFYMYLCVIMFLVFIALTLIFNYFFDWEVVFGFGLGG